MRITLEIDRETLDGPGEVSVSWTVEAATTVLLSDRGRVPATGSWTTRVEETTTVVLTAFDATRGKVACEQRTVTVASGLELVPAGLIVPWWGDGRRPPAGWVICDGQDGTPDLRGRFVRGAGGGVEAHEQGDAGAHDHGLAGAPPAPFPSEVAGEHRHRGADGRRATDLTGDDDMRVLAGDVDAGWEPAGAHAHAISVTLPDLSTVALDEPALPPWHALHYLMKR